MDSRKTHVAELLHPLMQVPYRAPPRPRSRSARFCKRVSWAAMASGVITMDSSNHVFGPDYRSFRPRQPVPDDFPAFIFPHPHHATLFLPRAARIAPWTGLAHGAGEDEQQRPCVAHKATLPVLPGAGGFPMTSLSSLIPVQSHLRAELWGVPTCAPSSKLGVRPFHAGALRSRWTAGPNGYGARGAPSSRARLVSNRRARTVTKSFKA